MQAARLLNHEPHAFGNVIHQIYSGISESNGIQPVLDQIAHSIGADQAYIEYSAPRVKGARPLNGPSGSPMNLWSLHFHGCQCLSATFNAPPYSHLTICFEKPLTAPSFGLEALQFLDLLHPHLQHYATLSPLMLQQQAEHNEWMQILNVLNIPLWVVNESLEVICSNQSADAWQQETQLLYQNKGILFARDVLQSKRLQSYVWQTQKISHSMDSNLGLNRQENGLRVSLGQGEQQDSVWLMPLKQDCYPSKGLVLISARKPIPSQSLLAERYGLTQRQAQLCTLLMQGQSSNQVAEQLNISINTVRNTLAACFRKLNVQNQSELIHLLFGTVFH